MEELVKELKQQLIDELNLEEMTPDAIDALEIILILERNYGIKIENPAEGKDIFYSVGTLARYIESHRA